MVLVCTCDLDSAKHWQSRDRPADRSLSNNTPPLHPQRYSIPIHSLFNPITSLSTSISVFPLQRKRLRTSSPRSAPLSCRFLSPSFLAHLLFAFPRALLCHRALPPLPSRLSPSSPSLPVSTFSCGARPPILTVSMLADSSSPHPVASFFPTPASSISPVPHPSRLLSMHCFFAWRVEMVGCPEVVRVRVRGVRASVRTCAGVYVWVGVVVGGR